MSEPVAKPETKTRFYPNRSDFDTHAQWDAHRQTYDQLYTLQDKVEAMSKAPASTPSAPSFPNQSHNTKIAGFNVSANLPKNGQTLKFNSATGMIEWS